MKLKLYNEFPDDSVEQIFINRGISRDNIAEWLKADISESVNSWTKLNYNGAVDKAVDRMSKALSNREKVALVVDCDVDGYTSSAIFINYFYKIAPDTVKDNWSFYHHDDKTHGLVDTLEKILKDDKLPSLIVCPDSASNDYEQHEILKELNIDVLILDHHEAPYISPHENVITINNQLCDYENKDLSGAGITWQFCRAYDEKNNLAYADTLLDLCAVGNAADMMNYTSLETRAIINEGLKEFKNPLLKVLAEKNAYVMNKHGGNSYMGVAFGIANFVNSICRSGFPEEKSFIFESMLEQNTDKLVNYTVRGHAGEMVPISVQAYKVCYDAKKRQGDLQDNSMTFIEEKIEKHNLLSKPVIICLCEPGDVEKNIAGLVANKLMAKYQRPVFVLTKSWGKDDKEYYYRGSARNYSLSEIENLRELCEESGYAEYATGHASAFGVSVKEKDIKLFEDFLCDKFSNVSKEPIYWIDYIWDQNKVKEQLVLSIGSHGDWWGTGMPEPRIGIKDISLSQCKITLMGAKKNTIKFILPSGLALIKFGVDEDFYNDCLKANKYMTIVGTCNANEWNGTITPQIIIEDYEIEEKWVF